MVEASVGSIFCEVEADDMDEAIDKAIDTWNAEEIVSNATYSVHEVIERGNATWQAGA